MLQKTTIKQNITFAVEAAGFTPIASNLPFSHHAAWWHPMLVHARTRIEDSLAGLAGATNQARAAL